MTHAHIPNLTSLLTVHPPPLPQSSTQNMDASNQMAEEIMNHSSPSGEMNHLDHMKRLKDTTTATSLSDNDQVAEVDRLSGEIATVLPELSKPKQKKRKKKRKKSKSIIREKLHQEIDEWRQEMHKRLIKEQELAEHKKFLRKCRNDNSRRIQEAMAFITKLETTVEWKRKLQSEDNQEIINKLQQLIAVWEDTLHEYKVEKCELEEKMGLTTKDKEKLWRECLFGAESWSNYYSMEEFISVRTAWDQCISSEVDASSIPFFWVIPPSSSSPTPDDHLWKEYRD